MLPSRSNTPADRSPASRTVVENAVRTKVCACSSTTAINRLHMICMWICDNAVFALDNIARPLITPARDARVTASYVFSLDPRNASAGNDPHMAIALIGNGPAVACHDWHAWA